MPLANSKRQFPTNRIQLLSLEQLYTPQDSHGRLYTARYERKGIQRQAAVLTSSATAVWVRLTYQLRLQESYESRLIADNIKGTRSFRCPSYTSKSNLKNVPCEMVSALGPSHANPRHSWRILNECPPPLHVVVPRQYHTDKMGERKANTRYSIGICSDLFRLTHDYLKNESNSTSNFSHCHLRRYYFC